MQDDGTSTGWEACVTFVLSELARFVSAGKAINGSCRRDYQPSVRRCEHRSKPSCELSIPISGCVLVGVHSDGERGGGRCVGVLNDCRILGGKRRGLELEDDATTAMTERAGGWRL